MAAGGGAWKVAYADFVTAMMAFFMVMWLTAQKPEVREAVAEHFRNPSGKRITGNDTKSIIDNSNRGTTSRRVVKSQGDKRSTEEATHRQMTDEGSVGNIGKIVQFELNSMDLSSAGAEELKQLLPELQGNQQRIEVRGHAANNGSAAEQSSLDAWTISFRRAMVVTQYLIDHGIDPRRIRPSAAGHSEPRLRQERAAPDLDSRVEVFVLTEVYEDPGSKTKRHQRNEALDAEAERLTKLEEEAAAHSAPQSHGH